MTVKYKVLLCERIHQVGIDKLKEHAEVIIARDASVETLKEDIVDVDAIIVRGSHVPSSVIEAGKRLKVIGRHGIGVDNIDLKAASKLGIKVVNTPDANAISVAEHVIAGMLFFSKRLREVENALKKGHFNQPGALPTLVDKLGYASYELCNKTLGLVGLGNIARRVAQISNNCFSMQILGYDPYIGCLGNEYDAINICKQIEEVFIKSDFVSLHVPLTEETNKMVDDYLLNLMKPTSFIINTARGEIIDEKSLYYALKEKVIAGAAIDVFETEPPDSNNPLFVLDNILVTPHSAGISDGALTRLALDVASGVLAVLNGKTPDYIVDSNNL